MRVVSRGRVYVFVMIDGEPALLTEGAVAMGKARAADQPDAVPSRWRRWLGWMGNSGAS